MQSRTARVALAVALVAVAVVLFVVLSDDDNGGGEDSVADTVPGRVAEGGDGGGASAPKVPVIVVRNGEPVGGVQQLDFTAGETIRFKVRSDVADEVHFHGYDVAKDVKAGGTVSFDVPADLEGGFEVELEERKEQLAEITVNPG